MRKQHDKKDYASVDEYRELMEAFYGVVGIVLFSISKQSLSTKQVILRNFMARSIKALKSIFALWDVENYQDCYVLLRCISDRLFHLQDLLSNDSFDKFEKWSFVAQYEYLNLAKSDFIAKDKICSVFYTPTDSDKEKYKQYKKEDHQYKRPDAEKIAKQMKLPILYKFGYDHASRFVHPMANDGQEDFFTITKLGDESEFPDHRVVLSNALLYAAILNNIAMSGYGFKWRSIVLEFFDQAMKFLDNGSKDYQFAFVKIGRLPLGYNLCVIE